MTVPIEAGNRADALRLMKFGLAEEIRCLHTAGTLMGVAVTYVGGRNGPGIGVLRATTYGESFSWKAPGSSSFGIEHVLDDDSEVILEDGEDTDKIIRIKPFPDYLSSSGGQAEVHLQDSYNEIGGPPKPYSQGLPMEYKIDLYNISSKSLLNLKIWTHIDEDDFYLSWDGIDWTFSDAEDSPNVLYHEELEADETKTLYIKRGVGAEIPQGRIAVLNLLFFSWDVLK